MQAKIQIQNCFKITAINNVCDFGLNLLQIWTFGIGLSENKYSAQDYLPENITSMVVPDNSLIDTPVWWGLIGVNQHVDDNEEMYFSELQANGNLDVQKGGGQISWVQGLDI